jgi:hypothetical protein
MAAMSACHNVSRRGFLGAAVSVAAMVDDNTQPSALRPSRSFGRSSRICRCAASWASTRAG